MNKTLILNLVFSIFLLANLLNAQNADHKGEAYLRINISPNSIPKDSLHGIEGKIKEAIESEGIQIISNETAEKMERQNLFLDIEIKDSLIINARGYGSTGDQTFNVLYPRKGFRINNSFDITKSVRKYIKDIILKKNKNKIIISK